MDESRGTDFATVTKSEDAVRQEIQAEALAAIERDKLDPRQQLYYFNKTTGLIIRTNAQYHRAVENRHELKLMTYKQAEGVYKQEQAARSRALNAKKKRKSAKQARKTNRDK